MKVVLIFFGPPGSGKGTQVKMISNKLNLPNISPGELFRKEIKKKTKLGKEVKSILAKGKLVSNSIVDKIIEKRLANNDTKNGFIMDGYPREKKQLDNLIKIINKITKEKDRVFSILVDVSDREVKDRLGGRRVCACGATYHIKFNAPKKKGICDVCGKKLFIRKDDKPKIIQNRLKLYHKKMIPILKYWEKENKLIKINGEQNIKSVHRDVLNSLKKVLW